MLSQRPSPKMGMASAPVVTAESTKLTVNQRMPVCSDVWLVRSSSVTRWIPRCSTARTGALDLCDKRAHRSTLPLGHRKAGGMARRDIVNAIVSLLLG